eukprot:TRINITY_DN2419_c0_g1_i9.p1 TRINITY_DN2419_c0_g1~~TRINITY_DN2419_c0_g1_i9.p1  ORF type:complete len:218 (+),score=24.57 TRINITY_DN2419_c0_g1_i9:68-721(+)
MNSFSNIREPKPKVSPVSIKEPTLKEKQVTHQLLQHLESMNLFESPMESSQRERVLASLHEITQGWCRDTLLKKGFSENLIQDACPKLFTFGSYRLGVHGPGADIDTLCVFPSQLERSDFFTTLFEKLNAMEEVTELTPVESAKVPVMKMIYSGIPIDLTCGSSGINAEYFFFFFFFFRVPVESEVGGNIVSCHKINLYFSKHCRECNLLLLLLLLS